MLDASLGLASRDFKVFDIFMLSYVLFLNFLIHLTSIICISGSS
jgi:hypothetical protein